MKKLILLSLFLAAIMTACYDDYTSDYEYTATYFSYQHPVRTVIIDPDAETFELKVGVVYGGRYSYDGKSETVGFSIEDTLINNNQAYLDKGVMVMPSSWYTITDDEGNEVSAFEIKNENVGFVNVSINKALMTAQADASQNTYAIPFVLTEATTDSILDGKHFSAVVVKYKNEFDGRYYVKGQDDELNPDGSVASSMTYSNDALVLNDYFFLNTIDQDMVVSRVGSKAADANYNYNMQIRSSDGKALLSLDESSAVSDLVGYGDYDFEAKTFVCKYSYTEAGVKHNVVDTLIYSNTEIELEDWMK